MCVGVCGCGNGIRVNSYTCDCDEGHELTLQGHDTVRVVKECGIFPLSSYGSVEFVKMLSGDVSVVTFCSCGASTFVSAMK